MTGQTRRGSAADHVTLDELTALCDVMVSLSRAGIPLDRGLVQLATDLPGRLSAQAQDISRRLQDGTSLADVVSSGTSPFPTVYASVVEAGIRSGRTTVALEGFARLARQLSELRRLVGSALVYPLVLMAILATISFALLRQLPRTLDFMLADLRLSSATDDSMLLNAYRWLAEWFWLLPILLLLLGIFWWLTTCGATAAQRDRFTDWVSWVPGAGRLLRNSRLLAFTEVLSLLIQQRVPMHEAVRLAGAASGDRGLREDGEKLAAEVERAERAGDPGKAASKHGIPPLLRWGLSNSQQVGRLEMTLERASRTYRRRTEDSAFWLRTFLPVIFSVCLGGFVTILYAAMFFVPWLMMLRIMADPLRLL